MPVDKLFGTIIAERVIDLLVLISLLILMFIINFEKIIIFFYSVFSKAQAFPINSILLFVLSLLAVSSTFFLYVKREINLQLL